MPDLEDDWMNPKPFHWQSPPPPKKGDVDFIIERAKREICFGSPGSIVKWRFWSSHKTAKERDKELRELSKQHPAWHLRPRDRDLYAEYHHIHPPFSHRGINP